ncbi:predicted protein [Botrytis cinerea T4]|uniref:Uncharacterized protein n=1 Tax=Botryotinia fuckeliana (strain T4) TaxID=999810 RepID=G2XY63_BOTF4|nr:predicted protein [Botrytis cinerea T4]
MRQGQNSSIEEFWSDFDLKGEFAGNGTGNGGPQGLRGIEAIIHGILCDHGLYAYRHYFFFGEFLKRVAERPPDV